MKPERWAWALATALLVPLGAAHSAENIACVDDGYSQDETAILERFYREFRFSNLDADSMPAEVLTAVTRRAGDCAEIHAWGPDAIEDATFYRVAGILKVALDRHSPLTPTQIQRLEQAIRSVDQARLNEIIGRITDASMTGTEATPTDADTMFLGRLIIRSGIPTTESNNEYVGAFLGARVMWEQSRRRFASR